MDGQVVIGTELDSKGFENDLDNLENVAKTKGKNSGKEFNDEFINELNNTNKEIITLINSLQEAYSEWQGINKENVFLQSDIKNAEKLKYVMLAIIDEIRKLSGETIIIKGINDNLVKTKSELSNIGSGLKKVVNNVAKWGLALFGIRGAYSLIRRAISLASSDNEQITNQLGQMRSVIANAVAPLVQNIVNLLAKAMVYINYIFSRLTGKNLFDFSNATKSASNSLKNGASSSGAIANNLKEARKQLAGFDEMNVLNDNVASSGGGGITDVSEGLENIFDKFKNIQIPSWIQKLVDILKTLRDNWQLVAIAVGSFATALATIKLVEFIKNLATSNSALQELNTLGISLVVAGLTMMAGSIIYILNNYDTMTEKQRILADTLVILGGVIAGVGVALMNGLSVGIGAVVGAIIGFIGWLGTSINTVKKEHEAIVNLTTAKQNLKKANEELATQSLDYVDKVKKAEEAEKDLKNAEESHKISSKDLAEQVLRGKIEYKDMSVAQKDVYEKYLKNIEAQEQLAEAKKKNTELLEKQRDKLDNYSASLMLNKLQVDENMRSLIQGYRDGTISAEEFKKRMTNIMNNLTEKEQELFKRGLPKDIREALKTQPIQTFEEHINSAFTHIDQKAESTFGNIKKNFKSLDGMSATMNINTKTTGVKSAKGAIIYPKLAVGGIVNQPGKGVPYRGATIGEKGAEGVIPLTDSQQMALLGESIGKYITINANITNTMNGRVISRELKKINAEDNFAYNR